MTKTLTEQWREGTLPDGWYYLDYDTQEVKVEIKYGRMYIGGIIVNRHSYGDDIDLMAIKGSVPSYDEYKRLQERNEKLKKMSFHYTPEEWNTMLRTIERLQEQLNEANEVIKYYIDVGVVTDETKENYEEEDWFCEPVAEEYCEKWGVK